MGQAIHHEANSISRLELWIKRRLPRVAEESQRFVISAFSFSISVIFTSIAVACASYVDNDFILTVDLILSLITMALCISVASIKLILATGITSLIISIITTIYLVIKHWDAFATFLTF